MHEAEKESLVNKIFDMRSLIRKVNNEGEKKVSYLKNKNDILKI